MNYQIPDLAGGAARRERFIFPTAASRVGPTNADTVPQAQVDAGIPEPDSNNTSPAGVSIGITGRLRQDAAIDPTVVIQIEDQQATVGSVTLADVESGRASVSDFLASRSQVNRVMVPRYSIRRTNYDQGDDVGQVGVSSSWELFQEIDVTPPDADVGVAAICQRGSAEFGEDSAGNLWLAVPGIDGSPDAVLVSLWRCKPSEVTSFEHMLTIDLDGDVGGNANASSGDVAWVRRGDDLYLLAGTNHPTTDAATFEVFLLQSHDSDTPTAQYVGRGFSGDTSAPNELTACDTDAGVIVAMRDGGNTSRMGRSIDLRNWEDDTGDGGLVEFSEFVLRRGDRVGSICPGSIRDIQAVSATTAWACSDFGDVYKTTDAGQNWRTSVTPASADENLIGPQPLYSVSFSGDIGFAVGSNGLILKTTDAGVTWTVWRYGAGGAALAFQSAQISSAEVAKVDILAVTLRKVKMVDVSRAWVVGDKGFIAYTSDAGTTWVTVNPAIHTGEWTDFVVDDAGSGNVLLAVGRYGVNNEGSGGVDSRKCAALFVNAETASPTVTPLQDDPDGLGFVAIAIERNADNPKPNAAPAVGYAVTHWGRVYRFDGDGTTVAFTAIATLPRAYSYADISAPDQATGGLPGDVVVSAVDSRGGASVIYQATGANTGSSAVFTGHQINERPFAIAMTDVDVGMIGGSEGLWRALATRNFRRYFDLLALPSGAVLLACRNATLDATEVYRAERPAPGAAPRYILQASIPEADTRAPHMARNVDGQVILSVGKTHLVSPDEGRTWVTAGASVVPVPISDQGETTDYLESGGNMRTRRTITQWLGGVLWSATVSADESKIGIYRAHHWAAGATYFRPIWQGVPLSLAVDGAMAVFSGAPAPRDIWTVRPRYGYRASYLATDSPSAETWRSKDRTTEVTLEWDAQAQAVTDALGGSRSLWSASFMGFFGANLRQATFRISDPGVSASFTSKAVSVSLDSGTAAGPASGTPVTSGSVLYVSGKTWTPGQWSPGVRRFYVAFTAQSEAFLIVGNGPDYLEIDGNADLSGSAGDRAFVIFSDRILWDGSGGTGPGSAGLLTTAFKHGRYLQSIIPAQDALSGADYFEAGRFFVGMEVAADSAARSFLYGLAFRPLVNTEQDISRGNIKSVRHYGRTGRLWEATYGHESPDKIGRLFGPIMERMREPFVIMWDGSDVDTSTLVRLAEPPEIQQTTGNLWNVRLILEEVG